MQITRTGNSGAEPEAGPTDPEVEIPEGLELFAATIDLGTTSPYFRAAVLNPQLPSLLLSDGLASRPHAPLIHVGGLAGHYPIGTGLLARRLAEIEGRDIANEAEACMAIDLNAATATAIEQDKDLTPDEIRARTFQATTDHNIKLGQSALKLANAAVPVLGTLEATRGLDFNTLSPGLALASTGMSAFNMVNTFGNAETTTLERTLAGVEFATSAASFVLEMTGTYKSLSDTLKFTSAAIAFYDTARTDRATILGLRPAGAAT